MKIILMNVVNRVADYIEMKRMNDSGMRKTYDMVDIPRRTLPRRMFVMWKIWTIQLTY